MAKKRNAIKEELERIRVSNKGLLTTHAVVKNARNKKSILHSQFEWDDSIAGHKYRLDQARHLIRVHVELYEDVSSPVRAYVNLTTDRYDRSKGGGYRSIGDVMNNRQWRAQLLSDAAAELLVFKSKYQCLTELNEVFAAIEKVTKRRRRKAS